MEYSAASRGVKNPRKTSEPLSNSIWKRFPHILLGPEVNNRVVIYVTVGVIAIALFQGVAFNLNLFENLRFSYAFDSDGPREVERLVNAIGAGSPWAIDYFIYGNTHLFLSYIIVAPISLVADEADLPAIAALGYVAWQVFFLGILAWSTHKISLQLSKNRVYASSVSLAVTAPIPVVFWTWNIHPDVVQLGLISLAVHLSIRGQSRWNFPLAGGVFGLAVGAKYISVVYALFFLVQAIFPVSNSTSKTWTKKLSSLLLFSCAALTTFAISNFAVFRNFQGFISQNRASADAIAAGFFAPGNENPLLWLPPLWAVAPVFFLLLAWGLATLYYSHRKQKSQQVFGNPLFLSALLTVLGGMVHLVLFATYRPPRYIMYLLPAMNVFLTALVFDGVKRQFLNRTLIARTIALASILMAGVSLVSNSMQFWAKINELKDSPKIAAGEFVSRYCAVDTPILVPMYSYLPPKMSNPVGYLTYEISEGQLVEARVLILNESVPGRYIWPDADSSELLKGAAFGSDKQFDLLLNSVFENSQFQKVFEANGVLVFSRESNSDCYFPQSVGEGGK